MSDTSDTRIDAHPRVQVGQLVSARSFGSDSREVLLQPMPGNAGIVTIYLHVSGLLPCVM
jgi:hypothetical protein